MDIDGRSLTYQEHAGFASLRRFSNLGSLLPQHGQGVEKEYFPHEVGGYCLSRNSTLAQNMTDPAKTLNRFQKRTKNLFATVPRRGIICRRVQKSRRDEEISEENNR
jgi:DNA-binding winged helix-turn-helix (wHTH) protein